MLFRVLRTVRHLPRTALTAAALLAALAWLSGQVERWAPFTARVQVAAVVLTAAALGWWALVWLAPAVSTKRWVRRRDDAAEHAGGVATWADVAEHASRAAMRAKAPQLRPTACTAQVRAARTAMAGRAWPVRAATIGAARVSARVTRRWVVPVESFAVPLVRPSWAPASRMVWSSCEEVTLRIGGPRSGKSGSLICHILDAPGAVLVTSSRLDLLDFTATTRARHGRVDVFNPTGLSGLASTVRWSPLAGCTDYGTAMRRARDLVPASASSEGERWDDQARGLLATLLHAAARTGGTMRTVLGWISPADLVARDEILTALDTDDDADGYDADADVVHSDRDAASARAAMVDQVRSLYSTNDRTLSSITTTLLPHLRWVLDPTIAAAGDARLDDPALLDVTGFVETGSGSLYLVGRDGGAHTLIGALTAEVAHQVRMHAAGQPGGRLDPPMTAVLDEAPLTCGPIPLHDWTSDMGGRNLTLHIGAQSLAQLRDVWGRERAASILANVGSLLVFGNIKSADDLTEVSTLCGTRLVPLDEDDVRPLPVMTAAEIGSLPPGTALLLRNGMRPVVGHAPMGWDRRPARLRPALQAAARSATATTRNLAVLAADVTRATTRATARGAAAGVQALQTYWVGKAARGGVGVDQPAAVTATAAATARQERAARFRAELDELFARPDLDLDDPTQTGDPTTQTDPAQTGPAQKNPIQTERGGAA